MQVHRAPERRRELIHDEKADGTARVFASALRCGHVFTPLPENSSFSELFPSDAMTPVNNRVRLGYDSTVDVVPGTTPGPVAGPDEREGESQNDENGEQLVFGPELPPHFGHPPTPGSPRDSDVEGERSVKAAPTISSRPSPPK